MSSEGGAVSGVNGGAVVLRVFEEREVGEEIDALDTQTDVDSGSGSWLDGGGSVQECGQDQGKEDGERRHEGEDGEENREQKGA